ncbi:hypothetical protein FRC06_010084 [Ceratobasidium sp. 370]|nr:hypothetical protein FRC06_010084 [Ceratobasidium sp. 370]
MYASRLRLRHYFPQYSFPSTSLIHQAFRTANEEAEAIFSRLGIAVTKSLCPPPPESMSAPGIVHTATEGNYTAPSIDTWFQDEEENDEMWIDPEMVCDFAEELRQLAAEIDALLKNEAFRWGTTTEIDDQMAAYGAASMALSIEERLQIESKLDRDDEENVKQARRLLFQVFLPIGLRPLVEANQINYGSLVEKDTNPSDVFSNLVTLRAQHETLFAKKSAHVSHLLKPETEVTTATDSDVVVKKSDASTSFARSALLKKVHSTLKSLQDASGSTSGIARRARHEGQADTAKAGNSANAAEAAKARVLTMYSKGGGKAGKHGWVNNQSNLASLSNLLVQLWEHWMENGFRSVPKQAASHYAKRYTHIRLQHVLYMVPSNEKLELCTDDLIRLNTSLSAIWNGLDKERERSQDNHHHASL